MPQQIPTLTNVDSVPSVSDHIHAAGPIPTMVVTFLIFSFYDGASARGGPWPPLQYASKPLDPLLCLSRPLSASSIHYVPRLIVGFRNN
jgi:hypothetical protein